MNNLQWQFLDCNSNPLAHRKILFTPTKTPETTASCKLTTADSYTFTASIDGTISASVVASTYRVDISTPLPAHYFYITATETGSYLTSGSIMSGSGQCVNFNLINLVKDPFSVKKVDLTPTWTYPYTLSGSIVVLSTTRSLTDSTGAVQFDDLTPGIYSVTCYGKVETGFYISVPYWEYTGSTGPCWCASDLLVVKPVKGIKVTLNNLDNSYVLTVSSSDARYVHAGGTTQMTTSWAQNAVTSIYSVSSLSSSYATQSLSSSFSYETISSSFAASTIFADTATSSSFADRTITADTATSASHSTFGTSASFADFGESASYADFGKSASYADFGKSASYGVRSSNSDSSSYSTFALTASHAENVVATSESSSWASASFSASFAGHSMSSDSSSWAGSSFSSSHALSADRAISASYAPSQATAATASYAEFAKSSSYTVTETIDTASWAYQALNAITSDFSDYGEYARTASYLEGGYAPAATSSLTTSYVLNPKITASHHGTFIHYDAGGNGLFLKTLSGTDTPGARLLVISAGDLVAYPGWADGLVVGDVRFYGYFTGSFTGSLQGSSSYASSASNANSSSHSARSISSSYALRAFSSSYALATTSASFASKAFLSDRVTVTDIGNGDAEHGIVFSSTTLGDTLVTNGGTTSVFSVNPGSGSIKAIIFKGALEGTASVATQSYSSSYLLNSRITASHHGLFVQYDGGGNGLFLKSLSGTDTPGARLLVQTSTDLVAWAGFADGLIINEVSMSGFFSGSFLGTASYAVSSSRAYSASFAERSDTASMALRIPSILPTTTEPMQVVGHENGSTVILQTGIYVHGGVIKSASFDGTASWATSAISSKTASYLVPTNHYTASNLRIDGELNVYGPMTASGLITVIVNTGDINADYGFIEMLTASIITASQVTASVFGTASNAGSSSWATTATRANQWRVDIDPHSYYYLTANDVQGASLVYVYNDGGNAVSFLSLTTASCYVGMSGVPFSVAGPLTASEGIRDSNLNNSVVYADAYGVYQAIPTSVVIAATASKATSASFAQESSKSYCSDFAIRAGAVTLPFDISDVTVTNSSPGVIDFTGFNVGLAATHFIGHASSASSSFSSSWASSSFSSSYAVKASTADSASHSARAISSSFSIRTISASYAPGQPTSSYASFALSASWAPQPVISPTSSYALKLHEFEYNLSASNNYLTSAITVLTHSATTYGAAWFDYYALSTDPNLGVNSIRAGTIMASWYDTDISFNEVTTTDIGVTTDITFQVVLSESVVKLLSNTNDYSWSVRAMGRYL